MIEVGLNNRDNLAVKFPYNEELVELMHQLPSRGFSKKTYLWEVPLLDLPILRDVFEPYVREHNVRITLTPTAKAKYLELLQEQKRLHNIATQTDIEYNPLALKNNVVLYPFQKVGAVYLQQAKKALLAFDMGLGKTVCSLSAAGDLIVQKKVFKPLIICPASLKFNWAIEIAKFSDFSYTIINGTAKQRKKLYENSSDFTILNYDLLRYDIEIINSIPWDLLITDEIQRAKNYATITAQNIRTIQPEYIFGLTGTPFENEFMELFTIMRFINPKMLGSNGLYFKERYCEVDGFGSIKGYKHELHHEIDRKTSFFMIRRKKRDVLKDLPERIEKNYYITLNPLEREIYNRFKKQVVQNMNVDLNATVGDVTSADVLTQIVYLREICDCINLIEPQDKVISSKLEELKNVLLDLPSETKVVIFSAYERMAQIIQDNLPYGSVHLHGGVKNECKLEREIEKTIRKANPDLKGKELDLKIHEAKQGAACKNCPYFKDNELCYTRKKLISIFNEDPNCKLFISTDAGREGLNLQIAPVVIHYDLSFNPAVNKQREGRIERIGQEADKILIITLICLETIEPNIVIKVAEKQALFDKIIDKADKNEKEFLRKMTVEDLISIM